MAATKKSVKWPDASEYTDKYVLPSTLPSKSDPWSSLNTERKIDMLTGRPRTPNDQYTVLTELQMKNLKKDATPFFMKDDPNSMEPGKRKGPVIRPAPIDRYATNTSQYLFRDNPPRSNPHCWIDDQWQREPPEQHNTARLGASLRWGPSKTGQRTIRHFHQEDTHQFLNIDVYKRNPTNIPSTVVMKYGRPSEGYYHQRNPNFNTWFGSTHRLNETNVLTTIRPKSYAEYDQFKNMEQNYHRHMASKWPEITEYTDKFMMRTGSEMKIDPMEERKRFHREERCRRQQEAEAQRQSQILQMEMSKASSSAEQTAKPIPA